MSYDGIDLGGCAKCELLDAGPGGTCDDCVRALRSKLETKTRALEQCEADNAKFLKQWNEGREQTEKYKRLYEALLKRNSELVNELTELEQHVGKDINKHLLDLVEENQNESSLILAHANEDREKLRVALLQVGEVRRLFSLWSEDKLEDVAFAGLMSGVLSGNDVPNKRVESSPTERPCCVEAYARGFDMGKARGEGR